VNRAQFVAGSAAAAAMAVEWFRSRALSAALSDAPALLDAEIIAGLDDTVLALIQTLLPFEHPRFPNVKPEQLRSRLYALFPIRTDPGVSTDELCLQHTRFIRDASSRFHNGRRDDLSSRFC